MPKKKEQKNRDSSIRVNNIQMRTTSDYFGVVFCFRGGRDFIVNVGVFSVKKKCIRILIWEYSCFKIFLSGCKYW